MSSRITESLDKLSEIIRGKEREIHLSLCCLLARGHLLIEDLPGMGKTTLAHALARVLGLGYQRVQFTSDLLPADILGVSVFDRESSSFRFQEGPVFSQLVLADEINRASPRTQSALLEAMEERQVTVDGSSRELPDPFIVIATQNPASQEGTFPLPESQLDRFLMKIQLGYPDPESEKAILKGDAGRINLDKIGRAFSSEQLRAFQCEVGNIHVSDMLLDYVLRLITFTREAGHFNAGLSPRAGQALLQSARAWAFISGRSFAIPEDVQAVFEAVAGHRLQAKDHGVSVREILKLVDVMQ